MIVYITINLINGKKYIGKDIKNNPKYLGSGSLFKEAVKKYGKENFKKEILEICSTIDELERRETYWIEYFNAIKDNMFYNIRENVKNWYSKADENKKQYVKNKISLSNKGKKLSNETKEKISKSNLGKIKGKYHTEESKLKISMKNKGRKHTLEEKQKISKNSKGIQKSEETKNKMSKSRKGHPMYTDEWREKISKGNLGRKVSIETKNKISQVKKGKPSSNPKKEIIQKSLQNEIIKEWSSITEAKKITNIKGIPNCLTGISKTAGGYVWEYKN
jgi:group I intron endonuclease